MKVILVLACVLLTAGSAWAGNIILDNWDIDTVAYPADSRLAETLRNDLDWSIEYEDDQAVLFTRP